MNRFVYSLIALLIVEAGNQATAGFIPVSAIASFTESNDGDSTGDFFTVINTSGPASGVKISSISVTLPSDLLFDTALNGPGTNPGSDFHAMAIPPGGFYSPSAFGTSFDGSRSLTIDFANFAPYDTFSFTIDVDRTAGSTPAGSDPRQVPGSVFAGTMLNVTFNGPNFPQPQTFSNSFVATDSLSAVSSVSGQAETIANPEPASVLLFGVGMAGVLVAFRKRTTAAGTD